VRLRILAACLVVAASLGGWWYYTRPRTITVCVFTDPAFRQRAGWSEILKARLQEVSRIYEHQVGIRWKAVDLTQADPFSALPGLDARRAALAGKMDCPADLMLAITGQGQGSRTASVSPFSHAAVIVDDPTVPESRNTLILAHELAHLFGASHETGSDSLMADQPANETFPPRAIRLIRQLRDYNFAHGVRGLDGKRDRQAVDALREELTGLSPEPEFQAHMILAAAIQADGENAQAVPHLEAAVKIDPKNVSARFNLAVALERIAREDAALETLREGVKLNPDSARLHSALGAVLIKTNREEAIDEFMTSLKLDPNNAPLYATLGDVLSNGMGRVDAAVLAYQDALKLAPGSIQARQGLARTLAAKAQAQDDAVLMRREAAKSPNDPGANYSLGVAEARAGDFEAAVRALERATQLQPKFGRAHVDLALIYYLRLNYTRAWTEVKAAREDGTEPEAVFIQALTRKLPPQ
jgi:Flp pilus assembly protein TadD